MTKEKESHDSNTSMARSLKDTLEVVRAIRSGSFVISRGAGEKDLVVSEEDLMNLVSEAKTIVHEMLFDNLYHWDGDLQEEEIETYPSAIEVLNEDSDMDYTIRLHEAIGGLIMRDIQDEDAFTDLLNSGTTEDVEVLLYQTIVDLIGQDDVTGQDDLLEEYRLYCGSKSCEEVETFIRDRDRRMGEE